MKSRKCIYSAAVGLSSLSVVCNVAVFTVAVIAIAGTAVGAQASRPNIIVIYTDDQGFGDVSALNPHAKFQTPNMDRLAREGIAFTNGHSSDSVCTPARYGLLTGRYSWRTPMKRGVMGAEGECLIADGRMTLASLLQSSGYHTAMVGKWHLGMDFPGTADDRDWSQPVQGMPLDKGFDYFYGVPASLNYGVLAWFEGRYAKVPPTMFTAKKPNDRHVDYRIMPPYDQAAPTTGKKSDAGLEVAPDFVDNQCLTRFTDKAIEWIDSKAKDAKSGKPFFLYLPYTSPHYPVCPLPQFHGQGSAGGYGEFVIETDHHIGRLLDSLQSAGIDDNTLIVLTSDNGPETSWAGRIKEFDHDSRGGLREGKRSVYEGGHRVPFLVRWPAGIAAPGRSWSKVVGQVDLLATLAELIGVALPANAGEDSQSFASVLTDPNHDYDRLPLINHGNGGGGFRYSITDGNWKLIANDGKTDAELFDLASDPAEQKNLAATESKTVQRLTEQLNAIVAGGRTTPGPVQANDTGYWQDLSWMTEQQYNDLSVKKPHAVIVLGTLHYSPELTMPKFAAELERFGFRTSVVMGVGDPERKTENVLPGIEVLADADLAIFFTRFLQLPDNEWQPIEDYLRSGKPVIGLRTASHSFKYPKDHPRFAWNDDFGRRAMGTPYIVHQSSATNIRVIESALTHPIMTHVTKKDWESPGTLYLTRLAEGCTPLVHGVGTGKAKVVQKAFGTFDVKQQESDVVAWAWRNEWGGKVFGTSFGHPGDFAEESFVRMLVNAACWSVAAPLPSADTAITTWEIQRADK